MQNSKIDLRKKFLILLASSVILFSIAYIADEATKSQEISASHYTEIYDEAKYFG